jgi:predicted ATPase
MIGRDADVARIERLFFDDDARLVTLTGPGGVGKTRLGLAVAHRLQSRVTEGAVFVDLAPLSDPNLVPSSVARALGLAHDPHSAPGDAAVTALRLRTLLLLLDNVEHLLDAASWIAQLLSSAPGIRMLVTSRTRLRIPGEHVVPIAPLVVPPIDIPMAELLRNPAVRLFYDRAREADDTFTLHDDDVPAVAELCRQLDGLPLALELAASRTTLFTPAQLLEQLDLPNAAPRMAPERHRTLDRAIAWSYDLLDPVAQTLYRRLAVFRGGFDLAAANTVAGDDGIDITQAVASLLDSSLLTRISVGATPRFRMLETIARDAAARLAASGEHDALRDRHARWMIALLEAADRDLLQCRNPSAWYARLDTEMDNLRAAVEFLLADGDGSRVHRLLSAASIYSMDRISPQEGCTWAMRALPMVENPVHPDTVIALSEVVVFATFLADLDTAGHTVERLRSLATRTGDPLAQAIAALAQGIYFQFRGDLDESTRHHEDALDRFQLLGLPAYTYFAMFELGNLWLLRGEPERARPLFIDGIAGARQTESTSELAYGYLYLGLTDMDRNQAAAVEALHSSLRYAQALRLERVTLAALSGIAGIAHARGDAERAAQLLGAIEAARRSAGVTVIAAPRLIAGIVARVTATLGDERAAICQTEGATWTYDQTLAVALEIAG